VAAAWTSKPEFPCAHTVTSVSVKRPGSRMVSQHGPLQEPVVCDKDLPRGKQATGKSVLRLTEEPVSFSRRATPHSERSAEGVEESK